MQTAQKILDVFEGFRMPVTAADQYLATGKALLTEKVTRFTNANKPVEFVMLGYPFKSINSRDKVLGTMPDLGEQVSLSNFAAFNQAVQQVYAPGIVMHLASDGLVFNDLMDVPDTTVAQYKERSIAMAAGAPVNFYDLNDFYKANGREKVMQQFGVTPEKLEQDILLNPDVNTLYRGMIRFMTEDMAIKDFISNSQLHKYAKKMAREMMFRNEAYSNLVKHNFSDKIRLSMHPSINGGEKYSFQLIPGAHALRSPWHSALCIDDAGNYLTMHRKEAEAAGYTLHYKDGQPYYYTTK